MANCKLCDQEITFDDWHISQKTGKKIPLDVYTEQPHDCPYGNSNSTIEDVITLAKIAA